MTQPNNTTPAGFVTPTNTARTTSTTTLPKNNLPTVDGLTTATEFAAKPNTGAAGITNNAILNNVAAVPTRDIHPNMDKTPNVKPGTNPKAV
jgi:hypothetical protein